MQSLRLSPRNIHKIELTAMSETHLYFRCRMPNGSESREQKLRHVTRKCRTGGG
jgi:hypothetical protein